MQARNSKALETEPEKWSFLQRALGALKIFEMGKIIDYSPRGNQCIRYVTGAVINLKQNEGFYRNLFVVASRI